MKKSQFKIITYNKSYKDILVKMLRKYLEFTAKFLRKEPWKCSVNIDHELAKTFDNLDQFTAPKGEIFLAIFEKKVVGTASIKMIRNDASELKRMYIDPKYRRQKKGQLLLETSIEKSVHFGANEMYLESPPPFKPAHKLYLKNGFELIEEYPEVNIPNELRLNWIYMKRSNLSKRGQ